MLEIKPPRGVETGTRCHEGTFDGERSLVHVRVDFIDSRRQLRRTLRPTRPSRLPERLTTRCHPNAFISALARFPSLHPPSSSLLSTRFLRYKILLRYRR